MSIAPNNEYVLIMVSDKRKVKPPPIPPAHNDFILRLDICSYIDRVYRAGLDCCWLLRRCPGEGGEQLAIPQQIAIGRWIDFHDASTI